jgi:glycosyltransferase involved in cell wall biosynthesis
VSFPEYDAVHPAVDRVVLTEVAKQLGADLFVSSYNTFVPGIRSLMPVYDLIPEVFGFHESERGWLERQLALAHADYYFAISRNTAADLVKYYPFVDAKSVAWTHLGVDTGLFHPTSSVEEAAFKAAHGLRDFMACVGSRYQKNGYKNGRLLVEALEGGAIADLDVVFAGGEKPTSEEQRACSAAGVRLVHVELDDQELAQCLGAASVLVFPSLYEGFGLPPLEALACGTPVVVTEAASLPEVCGRYGLYVSGHDPIELRHSIERATSSLWKALIVRDGPNWVSEFSWEKAASAFISACSRALDAPSRPSRQVLDQFLDDYTNTMVRLQR